MLHDIRKTGGKKFKWTFYVVLFFQKNKKLLKKLLILSLILVILFAPIISGNIIGNWIKDFFGTIINIVKTI